MTEPSTTELQETVRHRYAEAALAVSDGLGGGLSGASCCSPALVADDDETFGARLYAPTERNLIPVAAAEASLGCGNPTAVAELREGEVVLDLGSGGGIDVLLSAKRVGPTGFAYGLDMTDEMLELARRNQQEAGATNVEFLRGYMEDVPLAIGAVDVVISNCVINLSADKEKVFAEMWRVLRPGGRIGITDVVADDALSPAERAERGDWVGCVAGALSFTEYEQGLRGAGFDEITVTPTHAVADGMHSAIVKATKRAAVQG